MARDRTIGAALVIGAIIGVILYGALVFLIAPLLVLEITAFVGVLAILVILGWIGYVMATTPPPAPLEPEPSTTTATTTSAAASSTAATTAEKKDQPASSGMAS